MIHLQPYKHKVQERTCDRLETTLLQIKMHNMALNSSSWVLYNLRKLNICFYDTVLLYKNMTFIKISVRCEKVDHYKPIK